MLQKYKTHIASFFIGIAICLLSFWLIPPSGNPNKIVAKYQVKIDSINNILILKTIEADSLICIGDSLVNAIYFYENQDSIYKKKVTDYEKEISFLRGKTRNASINQLDAIWTE